MQAEIVDNADNWDDAIRKLVNANAVDDTRNSIDNPQGVDSPNDHDIESEKSEIKKEMQDTQMSFKVSK
jgi:hypothetical protein